MINTGSGKPYEFFTLYRRAIVGDAKAIDELRDGISDGSIDLPNIVDMLEYLSHDA